MSKVVHPHLINLDNNNSRDPTTFVYDGRVELTKGEVGIISSWNLNMIVEGLGEGEYKILEKYGPDLVMGEEYLLSIPRY